MKAVIRIPTREYAYIEAEVEGTPQEVIEQHEQMFKLYNGGFGLEPKEWCEALDKYLKGEGMTSDKYDAMNKEQQFVIQEIKKSNKRINK